MWNSKVDYKIKTFAPCYSDSYSLDVKFYVGFRWWDEFFSFFPCQYPCIRLLILTDNLLWWHWIPMAFLWKWPWSSGTYGPWTSWYFRGLGSDTGSTWMFTGNIFNKGMQCRLHFGYRWRHFGGTVAALNKQYFIWPFIFSCTRFFNHLIMLLIGNKDDSYSGHVYQQY